MLTDRSFVSSAFVRPAAVGTALNGYQSCLIAILFCQLISNSNFITRPKLLDYTSTREELLWRSGEVFQWMSEKKLSVSIDKVFPLAETSKAHVYLEAGKSTGKVLFDCTIKK
jgi:NADPH:quinone reductase-like Zn-dependent oxidoreductase